MSGPRLHIIVPVLNEAANVPRLMHSFRAIASELGGDYDIRFVMVDDGSTDGTAAAAQAAAGGLAFETLTHPTNRGPGRAFGTAFAHLAPTLQPTDWIATIEGDNTSRLELLPQMLTRSREGFDIVLASPYLYGGGISNTSVWRLLLSHVANLLVKETLGLRGIVTMSSFYRLYRGEMVLRLQGCYGPEIVERRGFECMVELLMKLVFLKASISEIAMPLDWRWRAGKSKMKIIPTVIGYLTLWMDRERWRARAHEHQARLAIA
jgi:dolichol-phosphate mannosyltransferase